MNGGEGAYLLIAFLIVRFLCIGQAAAAPTVEEQGLDAALKWLESSLDRNM
jgi:hypothetical protein